MFKYYFKNRIYKRHILSIAEYISDGKNLKIKPSDSSL